MINFGLIGCGYWGKNIARNIFQNEDCNLTCISDLSESNLNYVNKNFPKTKTTTVVELPKSIASVPRSLELILGRLIFSN